VVSSLLRTLLPGLKSRDEAPVVSADDAAARHADLALAMGIDRSPQCPGLWLRTSRDGRQRVYRVVDQNGELFATVGRLLPVAVPTARLPGHWAPVERQRRSGSGSSTT